MTSTKKPDTSDSKWNKALALTLTMTAGLAGAFGLLVGGWLLANSASGATIGDALAVTARTPWYFSRSAGLVAYMLLTASTAWGLLLSTKLLKESIPASLSLALHNILSWLAILLTGMHALALLWDNYYSYSLSSLTIPFAGPYRAGWVGLGIIGFYLMVITSISFSFRKQIGQKRWKQLHYATFAVFGLASLHGIMAGTDSGSTWIQAMYWGSALVVLGLTTYRVRRGDGSLRREIAS